jgi:hypothetical protein
MTMSVVTSVNTVGSKKLPPRAARLPPGTTLAPFSDRIGDMRLDLLDRLHVDQGPITAPGSNASATFIAPAVAASPLPFPPPLAGEGWVGVPPCTRMRLAQTGLAGIPIFRANCNNARDLYATGVVTFVCDLRFLRGAAVVVAVGLDTSKTITSVRARSSGARSPTSKDSSSRADLGPALPSARAGVGDASLPNQSTR